MGPHIAAPQSRPGPSVPGWRWALLPVVCLPATAFALALSRASAALAGRPWRYSAGWVGALGLRLDLQLDGLSLLFVLLVAGIGVLVVAYSIPYMAGERGLGRYYGSLLLFMAAMLGVVTAGNLLVLFIFWELTSIGSYLLISFRHEETASQENALQALLITGAGGLALLAGLILLGQAYGTFDLAAILAQPGLLRGHPHYLWILGLIAVGACTKSAQLPFHIWLPNAMVAPTPVSAYLHSATMVKAGVYLLARLHPVLGGTREWQIILLASGLATMFLGAWRALRQRDLKAILAYTTVSSLGMMVALLGFGTGQAVEAAIALLVAHALYKGALFLVVGAVEHGTGTRDVTLLGGLRAAMPGLATVSALAALSMAGLPPAFGFVAKELGYAAALSGPLAPGGRALVTVLFLAANAANVALAVVLGYRVFGGRAGGPWPGKPHAPLWLLVLPPAALAVASWAAGARPGLLDGLFAGAVALVHPASHPRALGLWHGWNEPLALSALTAACGGALYAFWPRLAAGARRQRLPISAASAYGWLFGTGLPRGATVVTRALQNGSLRSYLLTILATMVILVGGTLWGSGLVQRPISPFEGYSWPEAGMAALLVAATLSVAAARTRVGAIISLGAVGAMVTLLYVRLRAPDLALTQLLIEALTVILLLLVFHFLPPEFEDRPPKHRVFLDVTLAGAVGALMATLALVANGLLLAPSVAEFYKANSLVLAHGRNIVNAILVDFRGFDTLGEITVLATAAWGVYTLLKLREKGP